ncbi:MAG: DJ-1/PfpI family protein [Rhodocyclaceae bacterium]|nr:DJ-1/PfpI family protein [Rhodocyclaceae bacterium]MDQ8001600.1 DJ-1/PfpI family protein [Pseudomonadota bacterium]MDQ8016797.1 DJ-1/PfpI family protein [Pseudomonadota bacterium]
MPTSRAIWFLVFQDFQLLDVSGPLQVFATANDELRLAGRGALYETRVCAMEGGAVRSSSGVELLARALPKRLARAVHTVVLPGGPGIWQPGRPTGAAIETGAAAALADWTRRAAPRIDRLASVCTGAFVLARTGLLDGGSAVTHWAACEQLAAQFPAVAVQDDAIYLRHGRVWTSAGVTAGIDMALGMVEADVGRDVAMAVAKKLVVFYKRPGGQSQFSSALLEQSAGDARVAQLHQWIATQLRTPLSVARMADRLAMTPRTFARFYVAQTGSTPAHAVERIRLEQACRLVEAHQLSNKAIAQQCGFGSEEVMRRVFVRNLHVSPTGYRERFSAA